MAKGNLQACLPVTLAYEGGLSMIPSDPGNWTGGKVGVGALRGTNFGIAASAHPSLDIAHLTKVEAEAIYARDYWAPSGCETLAPGVDLSHFDGTVNSGRGRSARWLAAAGRGPAADQIRRYNSARLSFLQVLRGWRRFGKGWGARVASVEAKSLRMALGAGGVTGTAATATLAKSAAGHARRATTHAAGAHAATATAAGGSALAAGHHPVVAVGVGLLAIASAFALAFTGWRNGLRAAALAHEAAAPAALAHEAAAPAASAHEAAEGAATDHGA